VTTLGESKSFFLNEKAVGYHTVKRHCRPDLKGVILDSVSAVKAFLPSLFAGLPIEACYVVSTDSSGQLLGACRIGLGSTNRASVYLREVARFLIADTNATAFFVAHNHPGSSSRPSYEDKLVTTRIAELGRMLDCHLQDHFIYAEFSVGGQSISSAREDGWLE
jgi:DNA repair protein RadC